MRRLLLMLLMAIFALAGCSKTDNELDAVDPDDIITPDIGEEEDALTSLKYNISGAIQKGPFLQGSRITIWELNESLATTGRSHITTTKDNAGSFELNGEIESRYVLIEADGYYYNEVSGESSSSQLTLYSISDLQDSSAVNVNLLTSMSYERLRVLFNDSTRSAGEADSTTDSTDSEDSAVSTEVTDSQELEQLFSTALKAAEEEVLSAFGFTHTSESFDEMDISQSGDANAMLLAISVTLQSTRSVAEMNTLVATIGDEIAANGAIVTESIKSAITQGAVGIDYDAVGENLAARYSQTGASCSVPHFRDYLDSDGNGAVDSAEDWFLFKEGLSEYNMPQGGGTLTLTIESNVGYAYSIMGGTISSEDIANMVIERSSSTTNTDEVDVDYDNTTSTGTTTTTTTSDDSTTTDSTTGNTSTDGSTSGSISTGDSNTSTDGESDGSTSSGGDDLSISWVLCTEESEEQGAAIKSKSYTFAVVDSPSDSERYATILLTSTSGEVEPIIIYINQSQSFAFNNTTAQSEWEIGSEGGEVTISYSTNEEGYTIEVDGAASEWITLSEGSTSQGGTSATTSGLVNYSQSYTIAKNSTVDRRTGYIYIQKGSETIATNTIIQLEGGYTISYTTSHGTKEELEAPLYLSCEGLDLVFTIDANFTPSITTNSGGWATASTYNASDKSITLTLDKSEDTYMGVYIDRSCYVYIEDEVGSTRASLTIYQSRKGVLAAIDDQLSLSYVGGDLVIETISNSYGMDDYIEFKADVDWVSLKSIEQGELDVSYSNNNTALKLTLDVGENTAREAREGNATISFGGAEQSFKLSQLEATTTKVINTADGTLASQLSADDMAYLTDLKIIGEVSFSDFTYEGYPGGGYTSVGYCVSKMLSLKRLDISEAYFEEEWGLRELPDNMFYFYDYYGDFILEEITLPTIEHTISSSTLSDIKGTLKSIDFGGVKSIPESICYGWSTLEQVTIDKVTSIGSSAFAYSGLRSFTSPAGATITSLHGFFAGCTNLVSATLPEGATEMESTFYGCTSLTTVTIPSSVESLVNTFNGCSALKQITIPEGVTYLSGTFEDSGLTSIHIPSSVKELHGPLFYQCFNLSSVTFAVDSQLEKITGDTRTWDYDGVFTRTSISEIVIPKSVTTISGVNFYCESLKKLTFEEGSLLTTLSSYDTSTTSANYWGCFGGSGLTSIDLPSSLTTLGAGAFARWSGETLSLPYITSAGTGAFAYSAIKTLDAPLLKELTASAFSESTSEEIILPYVEKISGNNCFNSSTIRSISMPRASELYTTTFDGATALAMLEIGTGEGVAIETLSKFENCNSTGVALTLGSAASTANYSVSGTLVTVDGSPYTFRSVVQQ